ncbi:beta-N-acetylhexosaminidase [Haliangium sp.]|uniref:beta-N-acetylhexosaminidase n=1 Tax=Haliangium sp. TaxID=2663208 RepID=UPI003D119B8D
MSLSHDLRRDVGQLLWLGFEGTSPPSTLLEDIAEGDVGAVVLFRRNLADNGAGELSVSKLCALTDALHQAVPAGGMPLWVVIDQEGGSVQRVRAPATRWPAMMGFDRLGPGQDDAELAEAIGAAVGRELAALGIDVDFAPVLDVHTNPNNPVIGERAFGTDPEAVARRALAFARGLESVGVVSCGKHFPGHGDTDTDSHLALPRLDHDRARLDAVELLPFQRAVAARIPMLMTAHVVFAAIDDGVPATLSRAVITGLLREQMGYQGLIVSDDLDMRAIVAHVGVGEAAVAAIAAGCDALLLCRDPVHQRRARAALIDAGSDDRLMRDAIARAAERVRTAKAMHAAQIAELSRPGLDVLGCDAHQDLAARLGAASDD